MTVASTMSTNTPPQQTFDQDRFDAFLHRMLGDVGAAISGALVVLGDRLGLYRALAEAGPLTAEELAQRTSTDARYVREWLGNQAASGYLTYDAAGKRYTLPLEHAAFFADENSPVMMCGLYQVAQTLYVDEPHITESFRTGEGFGWHQHDQRLFPAVDRFFKPGYAANIVANWLPSLKGVIEKLQRGARVADVGCGHGTSTLLMAEAFPNSTFVGYDYHRPIVDAAQKEADKRGLGDRVRFEAAPAAGFAGTGFDLICCFDCVHDMGDPVGALTHIRAALASDGTLMIVEPFANDKVEDNLNAVGRIFYGASTLLCTPASRSQDVGLALGAQAGEAAMRAVCEEAGFRSFRRAAETPFNLIYEAKA